MTREKNRKNQRFGYFIAIDAILKLIVDKNYTSGDLLPSLKDMADTLLNGKIKQIRMAVKHLADNGVLESHRGRGIFVKDVNIAIEMFNEQQAESPAPSPEMHQDIEMPYMYQTLPKIKMVLVERQDNYKQVWNEIVDAFNIANHNFEVEISYTASPDVHMKSDLFQLQSFRIQPYLEQELACDLANVVSKKDQEQFHPNLFRGVRDGNKLFGMPITTILYGLYANTNAFSEHGIEVPENQFNFNEFIEYIKSMATQLKGDKAKLISNSLTLCYYMDLAGRSAVDDFFEKTNFKKSANMKFLKSFGEIYCDTDCFLPCSGAAPLNSVNSLFLEKATYSMKAEPQSEIDSFRLLAPPVNPDGYCPLIPHYICVSNQSQNKEKSFEFMQFLCSKQVAAHLTGKGIETGRIDVDIDPNVVKYYDAGVPEAWRNKEAANQLTIINNIFRRWQLSQITLEHALDMIEMVQKGKKAESLLSLGN